MLHGSGFDEYAFIDFEMILNRKTFMETPT